MALFIASSLEDIAQYFEKIRDELKARPTENTRKAQSWRNGQISGYSDCAMMLRNMEIRPDAPSAKKIIGADQDGNLVYDQPKLTRPQIP